MNVLQNLGDLLMAMVILGVGVYGWQHGMFLATLAGMQVFAAVVAGLALASEIEPLMLQAECPESIAFGAAFLAIFLVVLLLTRLAIGAGVAEDAVRFPPLIDRIGGPLMGIFAGMLLAGAILIAWSMAPVPESLRLDGSQLAIDAGSPLLRTAARCLEDDGLEERLLEAYATHDWTTKWDAVAPADASASGDEK